MSMARAARLPACWNPRPIAFRLSAGILAHAAAARSSISRQAAISNGSAAASSKRWRSRAWAPRSSRSSPFRLIRAGAPPSQPSGPGGSNVRLPARAQPRPDRHPGMSDSDAAPRGRLARPSRVIRRAASERGSAGAGHGLRQRTRCADRAGGRSSAPPSPPRLRRSRKLPASCVSSGIRRSSSAPPRPGSRYRA